MKKITVLILMICVLAGFVFADSFTVQNVTGRVQREAGGRRVDVRAGDVLTADTIIYTGVGANLILREGDRNLTVPSARSGRLGDLATLAAGTRVGGSVARVDTAAITRNTAQIATASARASDAAEDDDIASE